MHQWIDYYRNERQKPEFITRLKKELDWVQAARVAFLEGLPVYMKLAESEDQDLREAIRFVLADCVEDFEMVEPLLMKSFNEEIDVKGKTSALEALRDHWIGMNGAKVMDENLRDQRRDFLLVIILKVNNDLRLHQASASALLVLTKDQFLDQALQIFKQTILFHPETYWSIEISLNPYPKVALEWNFECLNHPEIEVRQSAIFSIFQVCLAWRWAAPLAAPKLAAVLNSDPNEQIRFFALVQFENLGRARNSVQSAIEKALRENSERIRNKAKEILRLLESPIKPFSFEMWISRTHEVQLPTDKLVKLLEERYVNKDFRTQSLISDITYTLEKRGHEAVSALSVLTQLLDINDVWIRVHSSRAVWAINPSASQIVLPILIESLEQGWVGVLAAECLGRMGKVAQEAIPKLNKITTSEHRFATNSNSIDLDEALQDAAKQAIELIGKDLAK